MTRTGRPPLPKGVAKQITFRFRCTSEERDKLERAAAAVGETVSEWSRKVLLAAATKIRK